MYQSVSREQIADTLIYLRDLFRKAPATSAERQRAQERREILTRNLLSNLSRTKEHPTLKAVLEIADAFSLTLDGAHRLFGYELEQIREYDLLLNAGRTHIVETYPFDRDRLVDVPFQFGDAEAFARSTALQELVPVWQADTPIHALQSGDWQQANGFYIRVGNDDSLETCLPPGALALVVPIDEVERQRPNPRAIYLLQFGNGYRCSRCVVTRGRLILLTSGRRYRGPQEFIYPESVRIVGRVRMFALSLPVPEYPTSSQLPDSKRGAPLILPWEHSSIDQLFQAKHRRFRRTRLDQLRIQEILETAFRTKLSIRTERRYRTATSSLPHVDTLIQLTVTHGARYTDVLRVQRLVRSDRGRFSLDVLLRTRNFEDLAGPNRRPLLPDPPERWTKLRNEFGEWPSLLSMRYPRLDLYGDRVVRLSEGVGSQALDPPITAGSLLLLEKSPDMAELSGDASLRGWNRPLYVLPKEGKFLCGHVAREEGQYVLLRSVHGNTENLPLGETDLAHLSRVSGVAVPV